LVKKTEGILGVNKHSNLKYCNSRAIENYKIAIKIIEAAKLGIQTKF
jgi:hypothetical protein